MAVWPQYFRGMLEEADQYPGQSLASVSLKGTDCDGKCISYYNLGEDINFLTMTSQTHIPIAPSFWQLNIVL